MSKVNFFEKFANMSLNNQSQNGDVNTVIKMMDDVSINKGLKTNKKNEQEKEEKFTHGSNIIFTKGQYKSYSGFVYEFYPSKIYVEISEMIYLSAVVFGEREIGDKIGLCCKIINKIDRMYGIMIGDGKQEVRIFKNYCMRIIFLNLNGIKRVGRIHNEELHIFDLKDVCNDYDTLLKLSQIVKEDKINELKYEIVNVNLYEVFHSEYCMIMKASDNCENDYTGEFGKISRMIEEQYVLECKKQVFIQKSMVEINNDKNEVFIKRGMYKDKVGKLLKFEKGSMKISIEALGLMIYSHTIKKDNLYLDKKITADDIFYKDLMLKDGNYFQISKVIGDKIYGTKLINNIYKDEIINKSDIRTFMPGCSINNIENIDECDKAEDDTKIYDNYEKSEEEEKDEEDDENNHQGDYETGNENIEITEKDMEVKEIEMKNSFKDIERSNYVSKVFTKEEKDIVKYISKTLEIIGYADDIINIYEIIEKISSIKNTIKKDLKLLKVEEWKESDMKYIIVCIVCYEIIKCGFSITKALFDTYIGKLIQMKYFIKSHILGSLFLREVSDDKIRTCIDVIKMNSDEKANINKIYKRGEYAEIIKIMINNCNLILQEIYGKVTFVDEIYKIEYIPVCKPKCIKEYPKYFITSNEIALGLDIPKTANKVIWNPDSIKVLKRLKTALIMKCNNEKNNTLKIVYKFVIENIDNAPFVLMNKVIGNKMDELKYKELKRTFDMFVNKIKVLLDEKQQLRNLKIQNIKEEKEIINKKRKEYVDNDTSLEEIELSMQKMMIRNTNILKRMKKA
jgi:hypothetical protein